MPVITSGEATKLDGWSGRWRTGVVTCSLVKHRGRVPVACNIQKFFFEVKVTVQVQGPRASQGRQEARRGEAELWSMKYGGDDEF
eukprot:scaffold185326_cov33-Tisochrysis_lutea.AAC.1